MIAKLYCLVGHVKWMVASRVLVLRQAILTVMDQKCLMIQLCISNMALRNDGWCVRMRCSCIAVVVSSDMCFHFKVSFALCQRNCSAITSREPDACCCS